MGYIHYRKGVSDLRHLRRASVAADGPGGLTALPLRHWRTRLAPRHRGACRPSVKPSWILERCDLSLTAR